MRGMALALTGLVVVVGAAPVYGKIEADPSKEYIITPEVGPWTICAASYIGEMSPKLAHDLVLELRTKYDLPAYSFNRGAEQRLEQEKAMQSRREMQRAFLREKGLNPDLITTRRTVRVEDQYAVLIGGYEDMDSAHQELERIKKLAAPQSVPLDKVISFLKPKSSDKPATERKETSVNPFLASFVVHNPAIPIDHQANSKPDPLLKQLNAGEDYSLLKCPKSWTLVVKDFQGSVVVQPEGQTSAAGGFWEKLGLGSNFGQQLNAAAMQAHEIAHVLREMHFEAYVLHTRYSSMVCVGGYDGPEDPQLTQTQRALANLRMVNEKNPNPATELRLFARPVPIEIPKF